jgi:hypothetical protein
MMAFQLPAWLRWRPEDPHASYWRPLPEVLEENARECDCGCCARCQLRSHVVALQTTNKVLQTALKKYRTPRFEEKTQCNHPGCPWVRR